MDKLWVKIGTHLIDHTWKRLREFIPSGTLAGEDIIERVVFELPWNSWNAEVGKWVDVGDVLDSLR